MPVFDPTGFRCPRCASRDLTKGEVMGALKSELGGWVHDSFRCKKCHLEFTLWG